MAVSPFVTSARQKLRVADVQNDRPNSENINAKLAGSVNSLIDSTFERIQVEWDSYFSDYDEYFRLAPIYIWKDSDIFRYSFSLLANGANNDNVINFKIIDSAGNFVNNLFGSGANRLLIGNNIAGSEMTIARDLENSITNTVNLTGITFQEGTLNVSTLLAGYCLIPFVESYGDNARSARFILDIREQ